MATKKAKGPLGRVVEALSKFMRTPVSDETNEVPDRKTTAEAKKYAAGARKPSTSKKTRGGTKKRKAGK